MALRISGLASGFDTEGIIKEAMRVEHMRIDTVRQQRQQVEWRQEMYRDVNTKFLALRSSLLSLKLQGTFMAKAVTSSDPTVLTATAGSAAVEGGFEIEVLALARGVSKESTPLDADYTHAGDPATFTLSGKNGSATITIEEGDRIRDVVDKINSSHSSSGIKATFDANLNKFYLFTAGTGSDAKIEIEDTDGFMAQTLMVDLETMAGTDASIRFNGGQELQFSSNQFTFNNINFNLLKAGEKATIDISPDIDYAFDKIKDFVEKYNATIEYITDKLGETRFRGFLPLTDEQRGEMAEKEIEKWEERAKSGLLRGDSALSGIYNQMRYLAMGTVSGLNSDYTSLSTIGINTGAWQEHGKLHLDEEKLRAALSKDTEGIMQLFTRNVEGSEYGQGLAVRLYDQVNSAMRQVTDIAGTVTIGQDDSNLGRELGRIDKRLDAMEKRLIATEDRYYRQFTAMEQALQRMNAQSQWLFQQFQNNFN